MDRVLSAAERAELMLLLGLQDECWGDIKAMQGAYRQKCRLYHPDKGGDEVKMKRLTCLFQTAYDNISKLRTGRRASWNTTQVGLELDFISLTEVLGERYSQFFMKGLSCFTGSKVGCCCCFCSLRKQHQVIKEEFGYPCLVWGQCLCFHCYCTWFGIDKTLETLVKWKLQIGNIHVNLLNLWDEILGNRTNW